MNRSCYWNHEINCPVGQIIMRHPELVDSLHCAKCGWNPDVERKRREEVKRRYGEKLQSPVQRGHEV